MQMTEADTPRERFTPGHPIGHFHSPIPDPDELRKHLRVDREALLREFEEIRPHLAGLAFPAEETEGRRYFTSNGVYPDGDAIILAGMLGRYRPSHVIEIGSGFSTACMLDTIYLRGLETRITCIEPHAQRLKSRLTPEDIARVTLIEQQVQGVSLDIFSALNAGDIVFIDSTHVMKTGSDVCFELFEILPRLVPGVIVHFHDIQYPFEYPDRWIYEKRYAWNEIYALRAFLMYNQRFDVSAFNSYFGNRYRALMEEAYGGKIDNSGASLWLRVNG
jgi:predicted O-methyltransferase YrrM